MINTTGKLASFWRFSLTTGSLPSDSLATILPPLATRHYLLRPSPAGYCLPPTAQLPKTERARSRRAGRLFQYVTEPGDLYGQNHLFLSTRCRPTVDHSFVAGDAQRQWLRRACRMVSAAMPVLSLISPSSSKQLGMVSPELHRGETVGLLRSPSRSTRGEVVPLGRWCNVHEREFGAPVPDHLPFGSNLTASLACS